VRATFAFYNYGGAPATGLRVRFNLPDGLRYVAGSAKVDDRPLDDVRGETALLVPSGVDVGEVPPGVERRIALAYAVAPTIENGAVLALQAALVANETDVIGSNVVRLRVQSAPILQNPDTFTVLEPVRVAEPGEDVHIVARVHNSGHATAHDVVIVLPVPERTSYVPGSTRVDGREAALDERAGEPFGLGNATVATPALAPGATVVVEYRARIDSPLDDNTRLVLSGAVASSETAEFELARAELTVRSASRFDTDATRLVLDAPSEVEPGRRVRVALIAENAGTCAADDVRIRLTLPEGLRYAPGSRALDGRSVGETDTPGAFVFPRVEAGRRIEAAIDAYVVSPAADGTPLPVTAQLQWSGGARPFERTLIVRSAPRFLDARNVLVLEGPAQVVPGGEVRASIRIANDGTAQATGVRIAIDTDPSVQSLRYADEGGEARVQATGIDVGTLAPGASRTFTLLGTVASPIADRLPIRLRARLESEQTPAIALGQIDLVVRSRPRFAPTSSSIVYPAGDALRPSGHGDLQIVLVNEGTDAARDVRLALEIAGDARIESIDGATRVGTTLLFGDVGPGARAEATLRLRLAPLVPRGTTITVSGRVEAVGLLPLALAPVTIATIAEPRFDEGAQLRTQPADTVDAGEPLYVRLTVRNTGDGAASRLTIRGMVPNQTAYLPGSTAINEVPLLDVDGGSVLWSKTGLVLEDVDPGTEVVVRYAAIVNTPLPAGTLIDPHVELAWDGGGALSLTAPAVRVRSTPAFAVRATGLPFSVAGVAPRTADVIRDVTEQRRAAEIPPPPPRAALPPAPPPPSAPPAPERAAYRSPDDAIDARFTDAHAEPAIAVAPPPAATADDAPPAIEIVPAPAFTAVEVAVVAEEVAPAAAAAPAVAPASIATVPGVRLTFTRESLERALGFLDQSDYGGLVTHLFAIRTLLPSAFVGVNGAVPAKLAAARDALRGVVDRLFIKMRMPRYALTAKDLEDRASRTTLVELIDALHDAHPAADEGPGDAAIVLDGPIALDRITADLATLENDPLGSPRPWLVLAELLPSRMVAPTGDDAVGVYRNALIATFTNVAALPSEEFHRVLAGAQNATLDAALRDVRTALRAALEATPTT